MSLYEINNIWEIGYAEWRKNGLAPDVGGQEMSYKDVKHALKELIVDKGLKISRSSGSILTVHDGTDYYFVEIADHSGRCYVIEAYGAEAMELHHEVMRISR